MKSHASMNRVYRLVFNAATGTYVAVAETARGRGKAGRAASRLLAAMLAAGGLGGVAGAAAQGMLPTGGAITSGTATISTNGSAMTVDQGSSAAILNWQNFSIGAGNSVRFNQPSASSVALNRVVGNSPSEIYGSLSANGKLMLVNQNGILMGQGASVDTGGFVGSTLNIKDADFLSGKYNFDIANNTGGVAGTIVNSGRINAPGGYVALIGPQVANSGFIAARTGTVAIGAGNKVSLDMVGDGLVNIKVDEAALNAAVVNAGSIEANGGSVLIKASSANALFDTVLNSTGVIRADSISTQNGRIVLDGGPAGITSVSGDLTARGINAGEAGGSIRVLGDKVGLFDGARIDASGSAGGGTVLVGGNWQGSGLERTASRAMVSKDAGIDVSATGSGNGGTVVVWSDGRTTMGGTVAARGGGQGGNGGSVETSGKGALDLQGAVDVTAAAGAGGIWLLDPNNIMIGGPNVNATVTSTTFQDDASANNATVSAAALGAALTGGATVNVQTSNSGTASGSAGDINVSSAVTAAGAGTLNFMANGSVIVTAAVSGAAGNALNIGLYAGSTGSPASIATAGGQAGSVATGAGTGTLDTKGGNLTVVGRGVVLGGSVSTGGGNITISSPTDAFSMQGLVNAGSGTVRIDAASVSQSNQIIAGALGIRTNANGGVDLGALNSISGPVAIFNNGLNTMTVFKNSPGLTVGSVGADAAGLFVATSGITTRGDITLFSGAALDVGTGITSNSGIVRLAGANVVGTGAISAATLSASATGNIALTGNNAVTGTVALVAGAGQAASFKNTTSYALGQVTGVASAPGTVSGMTATGATGRITLEQTAGTVTQAPTAGQSLITTGNVELTGNGNFLLGNASNSIATVAGSGAGTKKINSSSALVVATVGATTGLASTAGDVSLKSNASITLNQALNAAGTVRLQAQNAISQTASGVITAANLGVRSASANISLAASNSVGGTVALRAAPNTVLDYSSASGYQIGQIAVDGVYFDTATSGIEVFGGGRVALTQGAGTVTQAATNSAISTANLQLGGAGNFTLDNIANAVTTVAGNGAGSKKLAAGGTFEVGTVNGVVGLSSSAGDISTRTVGSLQLNQAVSAANGTVRLQADNGNISGAGGITATNLGARSGSGLILANANAVSGTVALAAANNTDIEFNNGSSYQLGQIAQDGAVFNAAASGIGIGTSGAVTLTQTSGTVTQSSNVADSKITAGALRLAGTGNFTLDNATNSVNIISGSATGNKTYVNAGSLQVGAGVPPGISGGAGNLSLLAKTGNLIVGQAVNTGTGSVTLQAENGAVTSAAAGSITTTGGKVVMASGSGGAVTLNGSVVTGGGDVTIKAGSTAALNNTVNAGAGTVRINAGGDVNQSGTITAGNLGVFSAGAVDLRSANAVAGGVAITASSGSATLFKNTQATTVGSIAADGTLFTAGSGITSGDVSLNSDGAINVGQGITASGTVRLEGASISGSAAIGAGNLGVRASTGGIALTGSNNVSGAVALATPSNQAVSFSSAGNYQLGSVATDGLLFTADAKGLTTGTATLTQTSGTVSQAATPTDSKIAVTGLVMNGNGNFTLDNLSNQVTNIAGNATGGKKVASASTINVTTVNGVSGFTGSGDVSLRALTGNIQLTSGISAGSGSVRLQSDTGTVAGPAAVIASDLGVRASGVISLEAASNAISGNVAVFNSATAATISRIFSTVGFNVGAVAADGALFSATTGISASEQQVTLSSGGDIAVNQAVNLGANSVLRMQAAGAVSQGAAGVITASSLGARGTSVDLANAGNTAGFVSFNASTGAVGYRNDNAFVIDSVGSDGTLFAATSGISAGGSVGLNSAGAISQQTGRAITSSGLAKTGSGSLTLSTANAINGPVAINGGTLAVNGAAGTIGSGAVTLAAGTTLDVRNSATLSNTVTSNGATVRSTSGAGTLSGALVLAGATTVAAAAGTGLTLSGAVAGNANALDITGNGQVNFGGSLNGLSTLTQAAGGTINLGPGQSVVSTGAQTYNGNVSGSNITFNAGDSSISATGAGNNFTGTLNLAGGNVSLVNNAALAALLNTTGATSLTAAGNLVTSGTSGALTTATSGGGTTSLGASTVNGALTVNSAGAVSQTGALAQNGAADAITITATAGNVKLNNSGNNVQGTVNLSAASGGVAFTNSNAAGIKVGNITASTTLNTTSPADLANFALSDAALNGAVVLRALQGNIERSGPSKIVADRAVLVAANRIGGASATDAALGLRVEGAAGATMRRVDVSAAATQPVSLFGAASLPVIAAISQDGASVLPKAVDVFYNGVSTYPVPAVPVPAEGSSGGSDSDSSSSSSSSGAAPSTAVQAQLTAQIEGEQATEEAGRGDGMRLDLDGVPNARAVMPQGFNADEIITVPSCESGATRPASKADC